MANARYTEKGPTPEDEFRIEHPDQAERTAVAHDLPIDVSGNETDRLFLEPGVEVHGGATLRSYPVDGEVPGDRYYDPAGGLVSSGTAPDFAGLQSSEDDAEVQHTNSDDEEEQRLAQLGDGEDEPPVAEAGDENRYAEDGVPDDEDEEENDRA